MACTRGTWLTSGEGALKSSLAVGQPAPGTGLPASTFFLGGMSFSNSDNSAQNAGKGGAAPPRPWAVSVGGLGGKK